MEAIQWHEPRPFRRARFYQSEKANPLAAIKTAGISFLVLLGLRLLVEIGPKREGQNPPGWMAIVGMAIPVSLFIAYGLPFCLSFISISRVVLSEKGINNNIIGVGATILYWPWEAISTFELKPALLGQTEYQTLCLLDAAGNQLAEFCLVGPQQIEGITEWAEAKGVAVEHHA